LLVGQPDFKLWHTQVRRIAWVVFMGSTQLLKDGVFLLSLVFQDVLSLSGVYFIVFLVLLFAVEGLSTIELLHQVVMIILPLLTLSAQVPEVRVLLFLKQLEGLLELRIPHHLILELVNGPLLLEDELQVPLALHSLRTDLLVLVELLEEKHVEGYGVDTLLCDVFEDGVGPQLLGDVLEVGAALHLVP